MILKKKFSASRCFWLSCLTLIGIFALSAGKAGAAPVEEWTLSLNESQLFPGAVARVDLVPARAVSSAVLLWKGVPIPLVSLSWQGSLTAFFGIPRNELPGSQTIELAVTALDGKVLNHSFPLVVLAKDYPVQQLTLPESKVSLDQASLDRHHREQEALKAALADLRRAPLWQEQFVMPVSGKVLSPFGVQRVLNGKPRNSHSGLDLRAPLGQPVVASAAGEVVLTADHFFSGKSVYINHGMGIVTMYFHLAEISVSPGEKVATGQMIGKAGSTGRSTGPHLHWGVRVHDCMVDPLTLLAVAGTAPGEGVSGVSIRD